MFIVSITNTIAIVNTTMIVVIIANVTESLQSPSTIFYSVCCHQYHKIESQDRGDGSNGDVGGDGGDGDVDDGGDDVGVGYVGDGDDEGEYCDTVTSRCSINACFANQNCTNTCFSDHTIAAATIYNHNYTNTSFSIQPYVPAAQCKSAGCLLATKSARSETRCWGWGSSLSLSLSLALEEISQRGGSCRASLLHKHLLLPPAIDIR